jgi:GDSL-like lipase/acylhydrolase family protein
MIAPIYNIPRAFRIFWLVFTVMAFVGSFSLLSHLSSSPEVLGRYSYGYSVVLTLAFLSAITIATGNSHKILPQIFMRRFEILLFVASSIIALSSMELAIRLIDPLGISYYEEERRYSREKVYDGTLQFRHPFSWKTEYQGVKVDFNEFGLRDEPIRAKSDEEYRLLVLGDSVTFGWGIEKHSTFCSQLQDILNAKLGRPVRVINAGVGGYNTVQEFLFLKDRAVSFKPDMVILVYTAENDTEVFAPRRLDTFNKIEDSVLWHSWLYRLASHAFYYGWMWEVEHDETAVRRSGGWQESIQTIAQLRDFSEGQGIPILLFYFRWLSSPRNTALLTDIQEVLGMHRAIDMSPWFAGEPIAEFINSKVDSHPNTRAHKRIAERMAPYLLGYPGSHGTVF